VGLKLPSETILYSIRSAWRQCDATRRVTREVTYCLAGGAGVDAAALGAEPRLQILRLLLAAHPEGMVVGEVQEEMGIPASTLSHHLEKLKQVGLVKVRREGTFLWYAADTDALREVLNFLYEECCTRSRAVAPETVVQISR